MQFTIPKSQYPVRMILDTDTFNEIDDQFALIYGLLSPREIDFRGVVAAPFFNENSTGPGDGMEKSYQEILHILKLTGFSGKVPAFRGAAQFLSDRHTPVDSEGAQFIIAEARRAHADGVMLYVTGIGAITNIGSALLLAPEIAAYITVVWLGGHRLDFHCANEFNLQGDVPAAQAVLASGAPFVQYPCGNCVDALGIKLPELRERLTGCGAIAEYLVGIFDRAVNGDENYARVIWDISTISYFVVPEATEFVTMPQPRLQDDCTWTPDPAGRPLIVAQAIDRTRVFESIFKRIQEFSRQH